MSSKLICDFSIINNRLKYKNPMNNLKALKVVSLTTITSWSSFCVSSEVIPSNASEVGGQKFD